MNDREPERYNLYANFANFVTSDITTSDPDVEKFLSNIYLMVKKHSKNCDHCKFILEAALPK
jgi:hypothetical protein